MNHKILRATFQGAAEKIDKEFVRKTGLEISVGEILESVFLKIYKKGWASDPQNPLDAEARIFFSVWVNESSLHKGKILYNIHAFKLRKLKGYSIESKKFAASFRSYFSKDQDQWENVRTDLGPITLMEGHIRFDPKKLENDILRLANMFLDIADLIDTVLLKFKK